jgi:hypothetical protein
MTTRDTLECRIYMTEDALYLRIGELDRRLHDLESRLKALSGEVHHVLCQGGRMSLAERTSRIVLAVERFEAGANLDRIRAIAGRVSSLKGLIDEYEREIERGPWMSDSDFDSQDLIDPDVLAAAS